MQETLIAAGGRSQSDAEVERHKNAMEVTHLHNRMEAVRLAQQILLENARNRPVSERTVTADEIETFASRLIKLVNE